MNHLPHEHETPVIRCSTDEHPWTSVPVATWMVDFESAKDVPFCSSCHFLLKREDPTLTDRRLPRKTLVFNLPRNLTNDELVAEIALHREQAEELGYWSVDRQFYDILTTDGYIRLTFRMT